MSGNPQGSSRRTPTLARVTSHSQLEHPVLPDEVFAEAVVLFFPDEPEPPLLVDAPGDVEHAVGPERERLVAAPPGETDALIDEAASQTEAARPGLDQ